MNLREDINSFIADLLVEGVETKNMRLAKHYLYDRMNYDEATAMKVIGGIKTDIPNSRLGKCKFMLGLVRMFCNGELKDYNVIDGINKSLKYAASGAHINEYNNDLNGLSSSEFINRFASVVSAGLENDKSDISSDVYNRNEEYEIVKINSFSESEEYGEYVDWCVTYDKNMFNTYTKGGSGVFYFCLRNGFEEEEAVVGEGCPLDSYGLSMIAVSVNSDGSCNTITCRWNHANNGNDSVMTTKELSKLLGINFYDVFKPLTPEEIESNKKEVLYEVEEELTSYMGYESPGEAGCDAREYDPDYGDTVETDAYVYLSDYADACVLIDYNWNLLSEELFDRINYREGDIMSVCRGDDMNFLTVNGKLLSNEWFDQTINDFRYGVGLCRKGKQWNAMRKDGSFIFDEWYDMVDLHGRYSNKSFFQISKNKLLMMCDLDGNFYFDRWYNRLFKVDEHNTFIKFDGDDFQTLVDSKTYKIKANYKVKKLGGYYNTFNETYYRVELIDGSDCLMDDDGNLYDFNTKELVYRNI